MSSLVVLFTCNFLKCVSIFHLAKRKIPKQNKSKKVLVMYNGTATLKAKSCSSKSCAWEWEMISYTVSPWETQRKIKIFLQQNLMFPVVADLFLDLKPFFSHSFLQAPSVQRYSCGARCKLLFLGLVTFLLETWTLTGLQNMSLWFDIFLSIKMYC